MPFRDRARQRHAHALTAAGRPAAPTTGRRLRQVAAVAWLAIVGAAGAQAAEPAVPPVMQGFPPAPEFRVTKANAYNAQNLRWSLTHGRELAPSRFIGPSAKPLALPERKLPALEQLSFAVGAERATLAQYLEATATDGFIVLHKGRVVYERALSGVSPRQPHTWASMAKSITGLLAAQFIAEGRLDPQARLAQYVPELAGNPFGEATVQQNLDMEVAVAYPEGVPPDLGLFAAAGLIPLREGMPGDIYAFLKVAQSPKDADGARKYFYQNGSAEAVAWALRRIANQSWAELVHQRLWSRFGGDESYAHVDPLGTEMSSGGFYASLRDSARFAELVRREYARKDRGDSMTAAVREVFKPATNQALFAAGNLAAGRPGYGYRTYWYQANDGMGSIEAAGRFGQKIYINPTREVVVVKLSSTLDLAPRATTAAGAGRSFDRALESPAAFSSLMGAVLNALPK